VTLPLTQRQEQLWRFIRSCDRSPSFVEMQEALGLASKSGVHRIISSLEAKGFVQRIPGLCRSITATQPADRSQGVVMIPLRGRIS
jgi:repressor LexA